MNRTASNSIQIYQHDGPSVFRFDIRGTLEGESVRDLEHAWISARSTTLGQTIVVDVSAISGIDSNGLRLLSRMRDSGARLRANRDAPFALASLLGMADRTAYTESDRFKVASILRPLLSWIRAGRLKPITRRSCR